MSDNEIKPLYDQGIEQLAHDSINEWYINKGQQVSADSEVRCMTFNQFFNRLVQFGKKVLLNESEIQRAASSSSETGAQDVAILDSYHVGFNAGVEKAARYVEKSVYSRINGSLPKAIRELREDRQS